MTAALTWNRYGKSSIRLVKLRRASEPHEVVDLTVDVALEGAFDKVYTDGDNRGCLPTDTMKNTVYALAKDHLIDHIESFGAMLAEHFSQKPGVGLAHIQIAEHSWSRLDAHAFVNEGREEWTTAVVHTGGRTSVASGIRGLTVMKTADSAFSGFPRDRYTTLQETRDRILATSIAATWNYAEGFQDYGQRTAIRAALLKIFAEHRSESVQHTLFAMGEAALAACEGVADIQLTLPNRHHLLVDLTPFGLDNPNDVFVATDQPYGLIEARVGRRARTEVRS
jgi:urate oxidase